MEEQAIIDRIRKLLALATSDNVNEAANAAAQAQRLMTKHRIEEAALAATPQAQAASTERPIHDVFTPSEGQRLATWAGRLASVVCDVNECKVYWHNKRELRIIGRPSDAQTARYLYTYLIAEIERLCGLGIREKCERDLISAALVDKTWRNNFRLGAVSVISSRLRTAQLDARKEMRQEAQASDTLGSGVALMRIDNALATLDANRATIEKMGKAIGLKARAASQARQDSDGRAAGERAGRSINLSTGRPLAAGAKAALKS